MTTSKSLDFADERVSKATEAGSEPILCFTISTPALPAQICSWSTAAARKVSAAPRRTFLSDFLNWCASLAIVVVLPTPLTPTTIITYGLCSEIEAKSKLPPGLFSSSRAAISSLRIKFNSLVLRNLSFETRSSIRSIIFSVVSTPTSELINTSSRLSSTSSSTLDLPTTARESFLKTLSFVFSNPLLRFSFFSLVKIPKRAIE